MEDLKWTGPSKAAEGMNPDLRELAERMTLWPSNAYWAACLESREGMQCYGWPENLKPECYTVFTYPQWLQARKDLGLEDWHTSLTDSPEEAAALEDMVNHPPHYQSENGIECIEAIRAQLTDDEFRGYCKGAALKYLWRERQKGGDESLKKAVWYLNKAVNS